MFRKCPYLGHLPQKFKGANLEKYKKDKKI